VFLRYTQAGKFLDAAEGGDETTPEAAGLRLDKRDADAATLRSNILADLEIERQGYLATGQTDLADLLALQIAEVGALLARLDPDAARAAFAAGATARKLAVRAPDNLSSLMGFFDRPPQQVTARLLCAISADGPGVTAAEVTALRLPVLVCGTPEDAVHPLALARRLAARIAQSSVVVLPPRGRDRPAHMAALQSAIRRFLKEL
jgi:pimeloyl-ACP methyl ester carboxylesterase